MHGSCGNVLSKTEHLEAAGKSVTGLFKASGAI